MTREEIGAKIEGILRRLIPDFDSLSALKPDWSLQRQLAADSMDMLNFVVALYEEFGVDVPERDYQKIATLDGCVDYLLAAIAARAARPAPR